MKAISNPRKWEWLSAVACTIAAVTAIASFIVIYNFGFTGWRKDLSSINIFVWSLCISSTISAILFAAIIIMVEDIYKNTILAISKDTISKNNISDEIENKPNMGLRITRIHREFPNSELKAGCLITKINGNFFSSKSQAESHLVIGDNIIEFNTVAGNTKTTIMPLSERDLLIECDTTPLSINKA